MRVFWSNAALVIAVGYLLFGRTFAYLGLPPARLYIGEIFLGIFLATHSKNVLSRFFSPLFRKDPLSSLSMWLLVFLIWGTLQTLRGTLILNHDTLATLQNAVFNYYTIYVFIGLICGGIDRNFIPKLVRCVAIINGIYGMAYIFWLNRIEITLPWTENVSLFAQPSGSVVALLGLISYYQLSIRNLLLYLLNFLVLIGVQVRGEWLAFAVGAIILVIFNKKAGHLIVSILITTILFFSMYITDLNVPSPAHRGEEISFEALIARAIAPLNQELAVEIYGEEALSLAGTITSWRIDWWRAIWETVNSDLSNALFGLGYGYPLYSLVPFVGEGVRTPHNVLLYALGYTGWIGVITFFLFQRALGFVLLQAYYHSRNGFGLAVWLGGLAGAFFGNFFETPFGAIPYYTILGASLSLINNINSRGGGR